MVHWEDFAVSSIRVVSGRWDFKWHTPQLLGTAPLPRLPSPEINGLTNRKTGHAIDKNLGKPNKHGPAHQLQTQPSHGFR